MTGAASPTGNQNKTHDRKKPFSDLGLVELKSDASNGQNAACSSDD
jgi:hypothetical protein